MLAVGRHRSRQAGSGSSSDALGGRRPGHGEDGDRQFDCAGCPQKVAKAPLSEPIGVRSAARPQMARMAGFQWSVGDGARAVAWTAASYPGPRRRVAAIITICARGFHRFESARPAGSERRRTRKILARGVIRAGEPIGRLEHESAAPSAMANPPRCGQTDAAKAGPRPVRQARTPIWRKAANQSGTREASALPRGHAARPSRKSRRPGSRRGCRWRRRHVAWQRPRRTGAAMRRRHRRAASQPEVWRGLHPCPYLWEEFLLR